jgi:hypothetical protein
MAEYLWGAGDDAIKPNPKTRYECNRTRYINKRLREGKAIGNVFDVAIAQVTGIPTKASKAKRPSRGRYESRVFVQEAA